ncbi:hypothetical protein PIB30_013060 [Stylosanthes scabra]|uniref:Uncharacterized protein n=1 Tax=Stylosanthes scabra TaxID=79078 RepID=A0ABU6T615_9FABA|nr:hypothetical protein [Stylosanthes scabra]
MAVIRVKRWQPELVAPATPTPHEVKLLSDIDDQEGLRIHVRNIYIYCHSPSMEGKDPVKVIRDALSRTLVFYYPFAGRLREGHGRKLMVDCTAEGVLFIEADADVTLDQLGQALQTPFPFCEELLYNVPGSDGIVGCPLLLIQVTRFKCGGFTFAIRMNHTMCDGAGFAQFMSALAEMARGAHQPSVLPIWQRELLSARNPPRITCNHPEFEKPKDIAEWQTIIGSIENMIERFFFFGPSDIASLGNLVRDQLGEAKYSTFELITAYSNWLLWKRYGISRGSTVEKLCENPITYAVELIKKAIAEVKEEYMHSLADLLVINGRPFYTLPWSFLATKLWRMGYRKMDFGWGNLVYGGLTGTDNVFADLSLMDYVNPNGEEGILLPILLPAKAMERFAKELDDMLGNPNQAIKSGNKSQHNSQV